MFDYLKHTFVFQRATETGIEEDIVTREGDIVGNAWLIGYTRSALERGWKLVSITTVTG